MNLKAAARVGAIVALSLWAGAVAASPATAPTSDAQDNVLTKDSVLRDADIPALGNPQGDITIVEYFDYQCPYCKKIAPVLDQVLRDDKQVRLVLKDWPILGDPSGYASRLVHATKYQDKYEAAHRALIGRTGKLTESVIEETLAEAGVDVDKAKADLATNKAAIDALMKRNTEQAQAFGFLGTPGFVVGTFRVPGGLTAEQFKMAIADARAAAKKEKPKSKGK